MIKVYVVDDSAVVRQTLMHLLQGDPEIELMGSAPNPLIAGPVIRKNRPDVLLLDIEMPGMDGLTFLRQIMDENPIPTVICSTLTANGSKMALDALAAGAVAVVAKPRLGLKQFLEESRRELVQTLPIFGDFDEHRLLGVAQEAGDILQDSEGLNAILGLIKGALKPRLRETAYALAVEVAASDLAVGKEELRFLAMLRDTLGLDKLVTAALERSAIARYQTE